MNESERRPGYLQQAVEKLLAGLGEDLIGVVLYGSHARGEAREESDADLLVIARGLPERRYDRAIHLQGIVRGIHDAPPFSVLGKTPEEFEGYFASLYLDIGLDGIVLYDREGYTTGKLNRIREIIATAGLFREQDNVNLYWDWKEAPMPHWEITWEGFREFS